MNQINATEYSHIGKSYLRKDGAEKVRGGMKYVDDYRPAGLLYAALITSAKAHARIVSIDTEEARKSEGVEGVFTGEDFPFRIGLYLGDKTPLARGKVRFYGEPVAAVVAETERQALAAAAKVKISYEELEVLATPEQALKEGAQLLHEHMEEYTHIPAILPEPGTNIGNRTKIRKGDVEAGFEEAEVTIESRVEFPPRDHAAMEPRAAIGQVRPDGQVIIHSSTQSPFEVRNLMTGGFDIRQGKITIVAPPIGGGFGGKAGIQLEPLAYLLSRELGGRPVRVANSREQDMVTSPGGPGLQATVELGAKRDGTLTAARIRFLFDSGAYGDYAVNVSRAAGYSATGPYRIPNVHSDSLSVYTNHSSATAFRGFGHIEMDFAVERAMDMLAERLEMDPVRLRQKNAIRPGDSTPTQNILDRNTGDLPQCIRNVAERLDWEEGSRFELDQHRVRAKGISCFWKAPAIPTFTDASAAVYFNDDGSLNLITGAIEIGQGIFTGLAQLVAERLGIDPEMVHTPHDIMTDRMAHDWTTAASRTLFMVGRAALQAVDEAVEKIKRTAAGPLRCPAEDLVVYGGRVYIKDEPEVGLSLPEVVTGYVYEGGNAVGGPIMGTGQYIARHLTDLDPETGKGRPGLEWTLGAEGVEMEVDLRDGSYRILKSACSIDVGKVINPQLARSQIVGAMAMGIGYTIREGFAYDGRERVINDDLRGYKVPRYGDHPEYFVDFVETPQGDGPYNARGLGEQGILGMPAAIAAALSRATQRHLTQLPLTAERVWQALREEE
jgi:CO/xanthine dehydrogenase Mo-binding subunit